MPFKQKIDNINNNTKEKQIIFSYNCKKDRCKKYNVSICEHQRQRNKFKECGGASICEHQRIRSRYKKYNVSICEHRRIRSRCK
jgi:hypothetical protein